MCGGGGWAKDYTAVVCGSFQGSGLQWQQTAATGDARERGARKGALVEKRLECKSYTLLPQAIARLNCFGCLEGGNGLGWRGVWDGLKGEGSRGARLSVSAFGT